jgi:hypothetical protein
VEFLRELHAADVVQMSLEEPRVVCVGLFF